MDLVDRRRLLLLGSVAMALAVWSSWGPELISDDLHRSVTPLASWTRLIAGSLGAGTRVLAEVPIG